MQESNVRAASTGEHSVRSTGEHSVGPGRNAKTSQSYRSCEKSRHSLRQIHSMHLGTRRVFISLLARVCEKLQKTHQLRETESFPSDQDKGSLLTAPKHCGGSATQIKRAKEKRRDSGNLREKKNFTNYILLLFCKTASHTAQASLETAM